MKNWKIRKKTWVLFSLTFNKNKFLSHWIQKNLKGIKKIPQKSMLNGVKQIIGNGVGFIVIGKFLEKKATEL